jgi:DNA-binding Lrp family transcriptional regulator
MIPGFESFVGLQILTWFLANPSADTHINRLARELGISPATVKRYTDLLVAQGIIRITRVGPVHQLALQNDAFPARELKRTFALLKLHEAGIAAIAPDSVAMAIFGHYADGTYDERSHLEILVIGHDRDVDLERVLDLEQDLGREIQITVLTPEAWEEQKAARDPFAERVLHTGVLVSGCDWP